MRFSRPLYDPQGTPTPAAAPAPEAPAQPAPAPAPADNTPQPAPAAQPAVPSPQEVEIQRLTRQLQQAEGSKPLADAAVTAGLKTPEDIARAQSAQAMVGELIEAGYDPAQVKSMLLGMRPKAPEAPQGPQPITAEDLQQSVREAVVGVQSEQQNTTAWNSAQSTLDTQITELAGDNPAAKGFIESRLTGLVQSQIGTYPDGHPLAGQHMPPTVEQITQAAELVKTEFGSLLGTNNTGNPQLNPAAAALNGSAVSMAGGGLQSGDGGNGVAGGATVPYWQMPEAQRRQIADQMFATAQQNQAGPIPGALASQGT